MTRRMRKLIDRQIELRIIEEETRRESREERELADLVDFGRCEWEPRQVTAA